MRLINVHLKMAEFLCKSTGGDFISASLQFRHRNALLLFIFAFCSFYFVSVVAILLLSIVFALFSSLYFCCYFYIVRRIFTERVPVLARRVQFILNFLEGKVSGATTCSE